MEIKLPLHGARVYRQPCQAGCVKETPWSLTDFSLAPPDLTKRPSTSEKTEALDSPRHPLTPPSSPSSCKLESHPPCWQRALGDV